MSTQDQLQGKGKNLQKKKLDSPLLTVWEVVIALPVEEMEKKLRPFCGKKRINF